MCQYCYDDTSRRNAEMHQRTLEAAANAPDGMRVCNRCRESKPIEDFRMEAGKKRHVYDHELSKTCIACRKYGREKMAECRSKWSVEKTKKFKEDKAVYHKEQRAEMLKAYGGQCVCCGETEPKFLAVDHVNNDGHTHRKQIGYDTAAMYRWAKKNGFPKSLQILCHNCNSAKEYYGKCPHQSVTL